MEETKARGIYWSIAAKEKVCSYKGKGSSPRRTLPLQRKRLAAMKKNSENKSSLKFTTAKLSFSSAKRFATAKTPFAAAKEGSIK